MDSVYNYITSPAFFIDTLPNWLQGLGTLVAIIGLFVAWKSLKKDNREQRAQMEVLMKQTEALSISVSTDSSILKELIELVKSTKDFQKLENEKAKARINPDLQVTGGNSSLIDMGIRERHYSFALINEGYGNAKNLEIKTEIKSKIINFKMNKDYKDKLVNDKKDSLSISISHEDGIPLENAIYGNILVTYYNIFKDEYVAEFEIISKDNSVTIYKMYEEEIM